MTDSLVNIMQLMVGVQQQEVMTGLLKGLVAYLIGPAVVITFGVLVSQYFVNKRSNRTLLQGLANEINGKVGFKKHDESITRVHKRFDDHVTLDNEIHTKMSNDISYIRGNIDVALKNGKQNAK